LNPFAAERQGGAVHQKHAKSISTSASDVRGPLARALHHAATWLWAGKEFSTKNPPSGFSGEGRTGRKIINEG
jgi:hypothetical protein